VIPSGFQRIRYYGFMGNRYRRKQLALCRRLLQMPEPPLETAAEPLSTRIAQLTGLDTVRCPACRQGTMLPLPLSQIQTLDSS
jgi:hypothetical protein